MSIDSAKLTGEQVEAYLQAHPEFFLKREALLADLHIPHRSGQAVSLVEKQQSILRERNTDLRNRLTSLVDTARENDRLFSHTRRLILSLLDCKNLAQAVDVIHASFANDFGVQKTQIVFFDGTSISRARQSSMIEAQEHIGRYLKARQTVGGGLSEAERQFLFADQASEIGSAALAVLAYGDIYGVLAIGNKDPDYYASSMGTLFLGYISEVLSRLLRDFMQIRK